MITQTLVSVDDIKDVTVIPISLSSRKVEPFISMAEEFYCYPILGDALRDELLLQVETGQTANTLTSLNQTLITKYIRPLVANGVLAEMISTPYKVTEKGMVKQSSDSSESLGLDELQFFMKSYKQKCSHYADKLKEYLDANVDSYPLYRSSSSCSNDGNGTISNSNGTGIYLGDAN